jgi:hypothetical protein
MNRRLDHLEQRLGVPHANIWDYILGFASFDDLDEDSKENLRQAVADFATDPVERIEQLVNAPLKGVDGSRPCRSQISAEIHYSEPPPDVRSETRLSVHPGLPVSESLLQSYTMQLTDAKEYAAIKRPTTC